MRLRFEFTITADVVVSKYFGDEEQDSAEMRLRLLDGEITKNIGRKSKEQVKRETMKQLRKDIMLRYNDAVNNSVFDYVEEESDFPDDFFDTDSETQYKIADDTISNYSDLEKQINVEFRVIETDTGREFGSQRLFRVGLRELWGKDIMYKNSPNCEDGCAYEYIQDKFGHKANFIKLAKDKNAINNAISLPRTQHKEIYEEVKKLYWDDFHSDDWDNKFPSTIPDNEVDIDDSWLKHHYDDLSKNNYTPKDIEKSMSILELLRWCIVAKVQLNILTGDGHTYLNYDPKKFDERVKDAKASIGVVAKDNHAYFIEDKNIKCGLSMSHKIHSTLEGLKIQKKPVGDDKEVKEIKQLTIDDGERQPPPTPKELINLTNTIYYCNSKTLNGLVNYLGQYHDFNPIYLHGSVSCVKEAVYDNGFSIMTEDAKPDWVKYDYDIEDSDLNKLYKQLPELKEFNGFPSYTQIANALAKRMKVHTDSHLNQRMRDIFYTSEIKPETRTFHNEEYVEGSKDNWVVRSFDIERAYSNVLAGMGEPNYYDSLTQPERYNQDFNPSWFYLCYNKSNNFPCRGKGLVLYHGIILELMIEKDLVEIKYQIRPPDYTKLPVNTSERFGGKYRLNGKKFVDNCNKIEEICPSISSKKLVNCWIGGLKKKEGIVGYSLYTERSVEQTKDYLYRGYSVRPLINKPYRGCVRLLAKPDIRECLSSGQPIRLAIIDKVNCILYEMMELCKFSLLGFKTDAMYVLCNPEIENNFVEEFNSGEIGWYHGAQIREEKEMELCDYYKTYGRVKNTQLGIKFVPNEWDNDIEINKKWSLNQGRMLLNLMLNNGGAWFNGKGGRGKTELIKILKKMVEHNRKIKVLWRCVWKSLGYKNLYDREAEFEKNNPCSVKIFAPTNKACVNVGGKTFHKGLGLPVTGSDEKDEGVKIEEGYLDLIIDGMKSDREKRKHALSIFVAEEISMIDAPKWDVMSYIKHKIPDIKFMMCGDIEHQLPPVGETRPLQNAIVIKELTNSMRITLNYNFRENSATDDIWEEVNEPDIILNRQSTTENGKFNICFSHRTRQRVITEVQDTLDNPDVFKTKQIKETHTGELKCVSGTPLMASETKTDYDIIKNDLWYYHGRLGDKVIVYKNKMIELEVEEFLRLFYSGYCITGHKCQGDTYDYDYVIHDWTSSFVDRRWRYVVVSRSTDYKNNVSIKKS